jgi:hypothetical protein
MTDYEIFEKSEQTNDKFATYHSSIEHLAVDEVIVQL